MSNELVKENQAQRREIKKLNEEIVRAGKVIAKADELYKASQQIPTAGFQANRDLAEAGKAYKQEKDKAKGEQEAR